MGGEYLELLYTALASEAGIVVQSDDPPRLRQKLYTARRESLDPSRDCLSFVESRTNPSEQLWIVKRPANGAA